MTAPEWIRELLTTLAVAALLLVLLLIWVLFTTPPAYGQSPPDGPVEATTPELVPPVPPDPSVALQSELWRLRRQVRKLNRQLRRKAARQQPAIKHTGPSYEERQALAHQAAYCAAQVQQERTRSIARGWQAEWARHRATADWKRDRCFVSRGLSPSMRGGGGGIDSIFLIN